MCGEKYVSKEHNVTCDLNVTWRSIRQGSNMVEVTSLLIAMMTNKILKIKSNLIG
jgi:hypothetical protein